MATERTRGRRTDQPHVLHIVLYDAASSANATDPGEVWIAKVSGTGRMDYHRLICGLLQRYASPARTRHGPAVREPDRQDVITEQNVVKDPHLLSLSERWMTYELLVYTRWVWTAGYEREVTHEEAVEILTNVREYAVVMLKAKSQMGESP